MKKLNISAVKPGDIIARTIFTESGNVLLGHGMELSDRYIERLKRMGIDTVYVEDKHTGDIIPEEVLRDETRKLAVETVYKTMTGLMDQPKMAGRCSLPDLGTSFRKIFGEIMVDVSAQKNVVINLSHLYGMDGYFFHHAVNVAVLAGILGMAKGYNRNQMIDLGVGALLFDIGMTQLPKELWNKRTSLNDEERQRIRFHSEEGFNMLRNQPNISVVSAHCALQHHERYDGSGYPRNLKKDEIHEFAQIVGLADFYDALISPRPFRTGYMPNEAVEYLFACGNQLFELELVKKFLGHIAIYPVATTVQLNTGHVGVVSFVDPLSVHRPTIRIIVEPDGSPTTSPYEIDLKKRENMSMIISKTL
ncbi:HD-GYP domain-containing protein [Brevibacillus fluminis]|uniref:HD-GYP domain-containing protein n=1 Tax=Brevibacillus fluminis TaxID=511487 RepID=A0A3M8D0N0_9BACL|nr:HD-GYP domain-containing protein [Brevibacillus fluminis]RNB81592.1 HD-GYP domain-containing protein [Brevibacillus fluminis]